jgi:hypothetical protein
MEEKRFMEEQIIKALKEHEAGAKVADIIRQVGIFEATFYSRRSKYGGWKSTKPSGSESWRWKTPNSRNYSLRH